LLRQTKFPPEFNQKVDMKKVNIEVMKRWIAGKISEVLGSEDDVVIELCFNLLEGHSQILQRAMEFVLERAVKPSGCTQRTPRGQEVGAASREDRCREGRTRCPEPQVPRTSTGA